MSNKNTREIGIDLLKTTLIFCVVYGHLIQYYGEEASCLNSFIWTFIYSFHMPLFIFLSGYCFTYKNETRKEIFKKAKQLLIPGISVSAIVVFVLLSNFYIKEFFYISISNLWFLKSLFYSILIMYGYRRNWKITVITIIILWFMLRSGLALAFGENNRLINCFILSIGGWNGCLFLYPFFILGYLMKHYKLLINKNNNIVFICFSLLYILLLVCFDKTFLVYYTPSNFYNFSTNILDYVAIYKTLYREIIGAIASLLIFQIFKKIKNAQTSVVLNYSSSIGKHTLGIYFFQSLLIEYNVFNIDFSLICKMK